MRLVSFDVGKNNLAIYVEELDLERLSKLRKKDVNEIAITGRQIHSSVSDLCNGEKTLTIDTRRRILSHLSGLREILEDCSYVIVEQQYFRTWAGRGRKGRGTEANVDAIKIGELIIGWFLDNYIFADVRYFGSKYKTSVFGAKKMSKPARKQWAIVKARELYKQRRKANSEEAWMTRIYRLADKVRRKRMNQEKALGYLEPFRESPTYIQTLAEQVIWKQKLDDISDAFLQAQAFKVVHLTLLKGK